MVEENTSHWIQQHKGDKVATVHHPQVQSIVRWCIHSRHIYQDMYTTHMHLYALHTYTHIHLTRQTTERHSEHSHEHRQHKWPHLAPLSDWIGWRSSSENTYIYTWIPSTVELKHWPVAAPVDPSLFSSWHSDIRALEAATPLHLLLQTFTHAHRHRSSLVP